MIVPINATDLNGNRKYTPLGKFDKLTWVMIRVIGAATVYLSSTMQELMSNPPVGSGASSTGMPIQAADGIVSFPWQGDLFCIADVDLAFVIIEYPNGG